MPTNQPCDTETPISTRKYLETLMEQLRIQTELRFSAAQMALEKADQAMGARLESMNEFRQQLIEERGMYVTRDHVDSRVKEIHAANERIDFRLQKLEQERAASAGNETRINETFSRIDRLDQRMQKVEQERAVMSALDSRILQSFERTERNDARIQKLEQENAANAGTNVRISQLFEMAKTNAGGIQKLEKESANLTGRFWAIGVVVTFLIVVVNIALKFI